MLIDRLTSCLEDLSKLLDIELKPDNNHSCLIKIKDKLEVQLELDRENQDYLIIGSLLGELPSGKFREEILFSALKANARSYPRIGSFAYSTKLNNLVLYELLNLNQISPETILSILTSFISKAHAWEEALENGEIDHRLEEKDFTTTDNDSIFKL